MKKIGVVLALAIVLVGCSSGKVTEKKDDVKKEETKKEEAKEKIYGIGETLVYSEDGKDLYTFTINSVVTTDERNQFSDKNPAKVVVINYTYENLADESDVYISSMNFKVIDADGNLCETYPAGTSVYPQAAPIGAKSTGEEAYGLIVDSSSIKLVFDPTYIGTTRVTFELPIQ